MSRLLSWPGVYFFYPFGNTIATPLTGDIPLDESAQALLLGCGDPRHILSTIANEHDNSQRRLDFTCCDQDPAVLARNVILLTMIMDSKPTDLVWNIFYHFRIDNLSKSTLIEHCTQLLAVSEAPQGWRNSKYGPALRMCTDYTLSEMRRHWKLYINMDNLPTKQKQSINTMFVKLSEKHLKHKLNVGILRSCVVLPAA